MNPLQRLRVRVGAIWYRIAGLAVWRQILAAALIYLFFFGLVHLPFPPSQKVLASARYILCEYQLTFALKELRQLEWLQDPAAWLPVFHPLPERELNLNPRPTTGEAGEAKMILPVEGEITSGFGWRHHPVLEEERFHYGIDIGAPEGTDIRAAAGGLVSRVEEHPELGLVVHLDHGAGLETLYAHCREVLVAENQPVQGGEIIATVGASGLAANPHLHFEIKERGVNVDPALWLGLPAEKGP
ncbi:MAG TPA: M23 family metallopeptidase [Firmicutes bacterium]|nr:M23 family metallopeptidase [Bacillota bacterium]